MSSDSDDDEEKTMGWSITVDKKDIVKRAAVDGEDGEDAPFLFSGGADGEATTEGGSTGALRRYAAPDPMEHSMAPPPGFRAKMGAVYQMMPSGRFKHLRDRKSQRRPGVAGANGIGEEEEDEDGRGGAGRGGGALAQFELVRFLARFTTVFFHVCQGLLTGFSLLQLIMVFSPKSSALLLEHYAFYSESIRQIFFALSAISTIGALMDWMQAVDDMAEGGDPFNFARAVADDDEEGKGERIVEMSLSGGDAEAEQLGCVAASVLSLGTGLRALTSGPIGVVLLLQFATYITSIVGGAVESQMYANHSFFIIVIIWHFIAKVTRLFAFSMLMISNLCYCEQVHRAVQEPQGRVFVR